MPRAELSPAQALLAELTQEELRRLARQNGVTLSGRPSRINLLRSIVAHLSLDELTDSLCRLFPGSEPVPEGIIRLDQVNRLTGETAVHACSCSHPGLGRLLLELRGSCLVLRVPSIPLFLENRWPVLVRDLGEVILKRLYAGFVQARRLHPAAQAPPPKNAPYILDEGYYGLRNSRLRVELKRTGVISFQVVFLRCRRPANRPEYLLLPIA